MEEEETFKRTQSENIIPVILVVVFLAVQLNLFKKLPERVIRTGTKVDNW